MLSLPPHSPTARNDDVFPPRAATARPPQPTHIDPYIAVHIRRGDKKAGEFPYRGSYVPLENFVTAARDAWARFYHDDVMNAAEHFPAPPIAYVASDSHAAAHDFVSAFPASTAVFSLDASTDPDLRALAPQSEHVHSEFVELSEQDRVRLTRGMVVDFAMLSGLWAWEGDVVPGATICTFRSVALFVLSIVSLLFDPNDTLQLNRLPPLCPWSRLEPCVRVRRRRGTPRRDYQ